LLPNTFWRLVFNLPVTPVRGGNTIDLYCKAQSRTRKADAINHLALITLITSRLGENSGVLPGQDKKPRADKTTVEGDISDRTTSHALHQLGLLRKKKKRTYGYAGRSAKRLKHFGAIGATIDFDDIVYTGAKAGNEQPRQCAADGIDWVNAFMRSSQERRHRTRPA